MQKSTQTPNVSFCPCGRGQYKFCCGRFHDGSQLPRTAADLMRSRYSAYVLSLTDYLLQTWHASTRPARSTLSADSGSTRWLGLSVKCHQPIDDHHATVEFVARYKPAGSGRADRLHETSRFVREDDRWFYVDGDMHDRTG